MLAICRGIRMKKIGILGSTGSIGTQTLEIVRSNKDLQVTALAAGRNTGKMEEQSGACTEGCR